MAIRERKMYFWSRNPVVDRFSYRSLNDSFFVVGAVVISHNGHVCL